MPAAAIATVAISAYAANNARKQANTANKNQQQAVDSQTQLGQDQLDFGKQQYGDWKDMFYGAAGQLRSLAEQEQRPDYDAITHDVGATFDASNAAASRNLERYGINPADGAYADQQTRYGIGRASAMVGARTQARQQAKDSQFNRLSSFYALGNGAQGQANSMIQGGYSNASNAYGNAANMYGNNANQYGAAAAAGANGIGYGINQLQNYFGGNGASTSVANSPAWGQSNSQPGWWNGYGSGSGSPPPYMGG